jgi:hypothetical protein
MLGQRYTYLGVERGLGVTGDINPKWSETYLALRPCSP